MTNMQTYEEFIAGGMKSSGYNPMKNVRKIVNKTVNHTERQIPPKHGSIRQIDKMNEMDMVHNKKGFTFGEVKNTKEPGKGRFSHLPDAYQNNRSKRKKDWKKTSKKIKSSLIKSFKDFPNFR